MHHTQFSNMGRRRFIGFAGASLAGAALMGCTGGSKTSAPAANNTSGSASTAAAPAASVKPASEITFWSAAPASSKAVDEELVKRFQAKFPDIKVKYEVQGSNYAELSDKLAASIAAKTAPDVAMLSDVWWFKYAAAKQTVPVDDLLKHPLLKEAGFDQADYVDSLMKDYQFNGKQWGMPYARSTPLFYYNKSVWQAAGLPDRGPKTWSEMDEWATKIMPKMGAGKFAFTNGKGSSYIAWTFHAVIWQFGGHYSDEKFNLLMNSPEGIAAGNYVRDQIFKMKYANVTSASETDDFVAGQTASIISSTGGLKGILDRSKGKFEVGTAFLPESKQFGCPTGGAGLSIMSSSSPEKQLAAALFIAFATSPENTAYYSQNTGYMPVRKSAATGPMAEFFKTNPQFKTAVDQLAKTQPQESARVWIPGGDAIIGTGPERMVLKNEDPKDVWPDVIKQLEKEAAPIKKQIGLS